jgi:hypothetical protein
VHGVFERDREAGDGMNKRKKVALRKHRIKARKMEARKKAGAVAAGGRRA